MSTNVIIFITLILLAILLTKRKRKILHKVAGIIKEVGDTGMLIENKDGIQLVNLEYVSRICEYPRKRKDKKF